MDLPASVCEIAEQISLKQQIYSIASEPGSTKTKLKLINNGEEIRGDALGKTAFLARFLVQCTLPHRDPGDVPIWTRKNGAYMLAIRPGWDHEKNQQKGYPFGTIPRLILIWMVTEAKRTQNKTLHLGGRMAEFTRELGLDASRGGKRSQTALIKDQLSRLIASSISYHKYYQTTEWDGEKLRRADLEHTKNLPIVSEAAIGWWEGTPTLDSTIELSADFFAEIMASAVPFDLRAVTMLRKSPLALDLYLLCNYLGATLSTREKASHHMTWKMLGEQLGCDYGDAHDMKRKIKAAMVKVKLAHHHLKVGFPKRGGIIIYESKPAIARRKPKTDVG